uniref:Uncharacterized protein n=1 Tax=Ixodes ricinus TaxID=34613 RepID=A0A0K8RJ21_IXORI
MFSASPWNPATMNVFTSHFNPITGRNEWELRPEEYDYHQEIARSSFADMLHDWEREKYMPWKANILVTEVFDTELIGEGAIETFTHALRELLEPDAIVVPHAATIYAQAVHSPFLRSFHTVSAVPVTGEQTVLVPKGVQDCAGVPAVQHST